MATDVRHLPLSTPAPHVPITSRLLGLGSVFGKTVRDSRVPGLVVAALLAVMVAAGGAVMADTYGTVAARAELAAMASDMPAMLRGMYGNPVNVDTLGGFVSWHYGTYFALLAGLWSILALSSTLAGEARRGSLDFAVATAQSRRAIAAQKVAGHVAVMAVVVAVVAVTAWATGALAATFPGDAIDPGAAASFAVGIAVRALAAGSIAFALASLLGRGTAAGIAGAFMLGGYVVHSYRTIVPAFDTIAGATWFSWTADHVPLAGRSDWAGVGLTALAAVAMLAIGIEAFARRDIGVTYALPGPSIPRVLLGVRGPVRRSLGDLLPGVLAWGTGLGIYSLLMAAVSGSMHDMLAGSPEIAEIFRKIIPGIDITTTAGFLQVAFADFGFVLIALTATTFIAARSADETSGRLEIQLVTPLTRTRWAIASGVAVWLAIAGVTAFLGVAIGIGVLATGQDPVLPMAGTLVLLAYGAALAGVGIAVAGLWRASLAMPVVLAIAVGTFLLDTLAPILRLPDWVAQIALTSHLGEPMIGTWDAAGIIACLVVALGGLTIGAWGMSRRDVGS